LVGFLHFNQEPVALLIAAIDVEDGLALHRCGPQELHVEVFEVRNPSCPSNIELRKLMSNSLLASEPKSFLKAKSV
jgi:hypothetical protein